MKEKLDAILASHVVAPNEDPVHNKLLAAGLVVVDKNGVLYSNSAGRQDFPRNSAPYTTSSISWIASMTKLATAACMLQLVEKGLITLDEDLRPKVPELGSFQILRGFTDTTATASTKEGHGLTEDPSGQPILEPNTEPITLRHLLTHTLGLGYDLADPDLVRWSAATGRTATNLDWTLEGFTTPLKFAPGKGWCYGAAYDWAGRLLTLLTGRTLGEYMAEHVFAPLGMESTGFWPERIDPEGERRLALAFASESSDDDRDVTLKPGPSPVPTQRQPSQGMESGGAGLYSTPSDYGRLLHGILTHRVLSEATTSSLLLGPQLQDTEDNPQRAMLERVIDSGRAALAPELPARDTRLDHTLVGLLNRDDIPGKRRAGSVMWSGMTNGRWWIDPRSGVAAAVLTCVLPHGNAAVASMWDQVERAVYEEISASRSG
ncbi:beta-lactamase/transpeptidase-like protein [Xylariales sp. PMI_506]|nr:beta-lactamase/transpeptidase-like protein [Xylariales sp. PMI_506]